MYTCWLGMESEGKPLLAFGVAQKDLAETMGLSMEPPKGKSSLMVTDPLTHEV